MGNDSNDRKLHAFRVGGYVRDMKLGLAPGDCDWVVVGHRPGELIERGFLQVDQDSTVYLHPETHEKYALARAQCKVSPGSRGIEVLDSPNVTLEDDLARRDFTINAMAIDGDGNLVDPFGGLEDLQAGVLRHISDVFAEDPIRVLRGARFAARFNFNIAPETMQLMRDMVGAGEVDNLTPEHVWSELWKALGEGQPSHFIRVLHACGALVRLFPELAALDGVPQTARHHPEVDSLTHVLMALDQVTAITTDPLTRFAVLVHDLGKGATPPDSWPQHRGHEAAGVPLVAALCERYRAPAECYMLGALVSQYHLEAHRALELRAGTVLRLFERLDAFRKPERVEAFIIACEADARGRLGLEKRDYPQALYLHECFAATQAISAREIVTHGISNSLVGEALHEARVQAVHTVKKRWQDQGTDKPPL